MGSAVVLGLLMICFCLLQGSLAATVRGRVIPTYLDQTNGPAASPPALGHCTLVAHPDPSVEGFFLFGGVVSGGNSSGQLWEHIIVSDGLSNTIGSWRRVADSTFGPRMGHSSYSFTSGDSIYVIVFGGSASGSSFQTSSFTALNDVQIWQRNLTDKAGQGTWLTPTGAASPRPSARLGHVMVPSSGSSSSPSIMFGGFDGPLSSGGQIFNDLWILTVEGSNFTWQQIAVADLPSVYYHGATLLNSDLFVVGGINGSDSQGQAFSIAQINGTQQVAQRSSYPPTGGIAAHHLLSLLDDQVLVTIGGGNSFGTTPALVNSIYVYDNSSDSWNALMTDSALGTFNNKVFPGVVARALRPSLSGLERIYVYGGFDDTAATSPTNSLLALDVYTVQNQTSGGSSDPLISTPELSMAFYNNTLALTTPDSTLPFMGIEFLQFVEVPFQVPNVTRTGRSIAWPSRSAFTVNTFGDSQTQGFTATTTLSNGANLVLSGFLYTAPTTLPLSPNTTLTTRPNSFKFSLDLTGGWTYENLTATEYLELQLSVTLSGNGLTGGFLGVDSQGVIEQYTFCTTSSCSQWQLPLTAFADGRFIDSVNVDAALPGQSVISVNFLFPPFVNSLLYDPEFTLSVPGTRFSYSDDDTKDLVVTMVAVFIPIFFLALCAVVIAACVLARLQGSRFVADPEDFKDDEEEEMMNYQDSSDEDDGDKNGKEKEKI